MDLWQHSLAHLIALCRLLGKLTLAFVAVVACLTVCHIAIVLYQYVVVFLKQVLFGHGG